MSVSEVQTLNQVVIRFAGDSGDGMQLTGSRFTADAAYFGNDVSTLPNFPAEIRAPQGTIPGVSSFQLHFASFDIVTPGDQPTVLVAMNPAALKANLPDVGRGGLVIVDTAEFTKRNLAKAGYVANPLEDGSLDGYQVVSLDLTGLTVAAVEPFDLGRKLASRAKNMFALGLLSWLYSRDTSHTEEFLARKFATSTLLRDSNIAAFKAGYNYGMTTEVFQTRYQVPQAQLPAGQYRQISGNLATAYGLMVGAERCGMQLFLGSYPITPASDILHALSRQKGAGVLSFQAEDEIAGAGAALGASLAGALGVTTTSGPGLALKGETIGLAVMMEAPLVVIDVQRAGPSTGMPTKTEQADLFQAMFGRNGESPVAVLAPQSASDCFHATFEACQIAVKYRTPVLVLSDGYLGNGAEPWRIPQIEDLPKLNPGYATEPNTVDEKGTPVFHPYLRDPKTLARAVAIPGTPGLEHRLGGLEKNQTGSISYVPENHDQMVRARQAKIDGIVRDIPDVEVDDPGKDAEVLVLGWGSTYGSIIEACREVRACGRKIARAHLRHLNPFPANLGQVLSSYKTVIVPEINLGQLTMLLRSRYLIDVQSYSRVRGLPLSSSELAAELITLADGFVMEDNDD